MPPYERLLQLLAESLRSAGFSVEVAGTHLTVMGVDFYCRGIHRKTMVEFMHRQYRFTRWTVEPSIDTAIADIVREVGERLELRRRRAERLAAAASAEEKRKLAQEQHKERCEQLAKLTESTFYNVTLVREGVVRVSDKVLMLVTPTGFAVTYESESFDRAWAATDFLQEL